MRSGWVLGVVLAGPWVVGGCRGTVARSVSPPPAAGAAPAAPSAAGAAKTAPGAVDLGSITLRVPASWQRQPSSTSFRLAQYAIPEAPGEKAPALFVAFYFGKGQGGPVEANIQRWISMVRQPNGADSHAVAHRGSLNRPGLRISTLDVSGTYMDMPNMFSGQVIARPHSRMLAAVVETTKPSGQGPYFLRLVGPARSVSAAKPGWDAMLASAGVK